MVKKEIAPESESEPDEASSSEGEAEDEKQYQVEYIEKARVTDEGGWEYFVKWAGFKDSDNSWEPYENVSSCERLLKRFWEDVGVDDNDWNAGDTFEASKKLIEEEKRYFVQNFGVPKERKPEKRIAFTISASASTAKKPKPKPILGDPESDDSDSRPIIQTNAKKRPKVKSSDEDSDDTPLLRKSRKISDAGGSKVAPDSTKKVTGKKVGRPKASTNVARAAKASERRQSSVASSSKASSSKGQKGQGTSSKAIKGGQGGDKGKQVAHSPSSPAARASTPGSTHSLFSSPDISLSQLPPESPPTAGTSKATKSNLPSHVEKKANPRVKLLDIPPPNVMPPLTVGIPAKQRLALKATTLTPVNAKGPPPSNPIEKKPILSQLSFTKRKASTATTGDTRSPISPQVASASAFGKPQPGLLTDRDMVQSPTDDSWFKVPAPPLPRTGHLPLPRRASSSNMSVQNTAPTEVDDFLAPMEMLFVDPPPQPKEIPRAALGPLALPRIQRKWKWEGELHVQSDKDQSRMLCKVALNEASDPRKCGLPFKLCIGEQKSILLRKMHDISDLMLVLPACAAFTQACKVGPQEAADSDVLKTLEKFMRKKRMFTYAPALLDGDPTGLIIVFPSAFDDLSDLFQLPPNLRAPDGLVAVLCPWMLPIGDFEKYDWVSKENLLQPEKSLLDPGYAGIMRSATRKQVLDNPLYQRGLRILKFPKYLHDFMSKPNRPYCLWYGQATGSGQPPTPPDYETACLQAILNHCGATNVGLKKDVKAVFLHVGMLPTMWKVGAMSARRSKRPELRFFTYGTHETVHPSRWGLKEVWPIGGVVTFTMKAVTENLFDVCRLVDRVNRHPLWTCFIPPVVVGAVAKATSKGSDPLVLFDRNEGFCAPLLSLIEDGKLSLLTAPPLRRQPREIGTGKGWADLRTAWISGQFSLISMKSRSILDACLRSFDALHGKTPESEIASAVAQNAMKEMDSMQFQPVIMDEYRRFVVVKGATEKVHDDDREILEVVSCSSFDFKDDYFESSKK